MRGKPSRSGCCGLLVCLTKSTCERLLGGVAPSVGHLRERHFTAVVLGDVLCTAEVLDEAGASVTDFLRGCVADARELGVIAPIADPGCEFAHRVELLDDRTAGVRGNVEALNSIKCPRSDGVAGGIFLTAPDGFQPSKVLATVPRLPQDLRVLLGESDLRGVRDGLEVGILEIGNVFGAGGGVFGVVATVDGLDVLI